MGKANNRSLHLDEYCLGVLLYLFNPAITSLRGIQQASELRNVRKKLGLKRASLGSLSESVSVFDPEPLKQIAVDLAEGVLSDRVATMGATRKVSERPDHSIRIIEVAATPHTSRGKYKGSSTGHSSDGKMRIATNLLDAPAELISKLFRLRWMIELFFRMIKGMLACSHLLSRALSRLSFAISWVSFLFGFGLRPR